MRTCFRWIVFWVIILIITVPMQLYATCQIVGNTPDGGYIIVCDGPDTIGINSGSGSDIITINIGAQVSKSDIIVGSPAPSASAVVINAGSGNNEISNRGRIEGNASESESISVNVTDPIGLITASAGAYADSVGIVTLNGADVITNSATGTIVVNAVATANAEVDIDFGLGDNQGDGSAFSGAQASAVGINAGSGPNRVTNNGSITVNATAIAIAEAETDWANGPDDRFTIAGDWSPAYATGIVTGAGDDIITNTSTGAIDVTATINIDLTSDIWGVPDVKAEAINDFYPYSIAEAVGINAGEGVNVITNNGTLTVNATANIEVETDALQHIPIMDVLVESLADTTVTANAKGIAAGDGNNTISNSGSINVSATVDGKSDADGEAVSPSSAATSTSTLDLIANATGISVGNGNNVIDNEGTITVKALSVPVWTLEDAYAESTEHGYANLTRTANATGIIVGNGNNEIDNQGSIDVGATAEGNSHAHTNSVWTTNDAHATTNLTANAIGIAVGNGPNSIDNSGTISVTAKILTGSATDSVGWAYDAYGWGDEDGDGTVSLTANATGISAGDGNNTINNDGTIIVQAVTEKAVPGASVASADARVSAFWHATRSDAVSTAIGNATGISLGDGTNEVNNRGDIEVDALMIASGYAYADSVSEQATAVVITASTANATGISAGVGDNTITNDATIKVRATANAVGQAYAWTDSSLHNGTADTTSTSKAIATGISVEGGPDAKNAIQNSTLGNITVEARAEGSAYASNGEHATAATTLKATATGISAGKGENLIYNYGYMGVIAVAGRDEDGNPLIIADADTSTSTTSNYATSTGRSIVDAAGILAGDGTNFISNQGTIIVSGTGHAMVSKTEAFSRDQNPHADVRSNAASTVVGISTGGGFNEIGNNGLLDVDAWTEAYAQGWADSVSSTTHTNVHAGTIAGATGISVGNTDSIIQNVVNIIHNEDGGTINVNSAATSIAYSSSDENAKVGTSKDDPGIQTSAFATGISAIGETNQITNDGSITVEAKANGEGDAHAESDAFDTDTAIWVSVDASAATGIATGIGSSEIINNGVVQVSSIASSEIYSYSDSVDDADATGGATVTAKAWGINASGNNALVTNAGTLDVYANATAKGNSRADSGGDGYGTAIFEANSNADAIGISVGDGGAVWNQGQAKITVDAKAIIDVSANGDEFGTIGTSKESPGATARATAVGISMGNGDNQIINEGSISVNAEGNINAKSRSLSTTRSTHTNTWALAGATATGLTVGQGESSIINTGDLEVNAKAIASLNDPNSGWGTYWRSDSWYNADAKTGAYAYSYATGIEASADNSGNPGNTVITNSGTVTVNSVATARGNAAGDRGGSSDGTATTYAEASAEASGFFVGSGNKLVSIENSGALEVKSTADTLAFSHGDTDSWSYAKSLGYAYGIKVGDNNELVSIKNSGTMRVESTATSDTADDEPWRQSDASSNVYGINIGNSNSEIVNSGAIDIISKANAKLFTDEDTAVSTISSAYATGISIGNGTNTISSNSQIQVKATAESKPDGGNFNSTNMATAQAIGIKTGSGSDTVTLGAGPVINAEANANTFSYNGATNASAIGIDAGDGANQITNQGTISVFGNATAEVEKSIFIWDITWPATANSSVTGIKSGTGADIINNYGQIIVNSEARAVSPNVPDLSLPGAKMATSNAIGINAGNGDNFIVNYGTIDVSALAAAGTGASPQARTDGVESTTAIGIKTGNGNDAIINSGAINTANKSLEWIGSSTSITSQPGIAITSGAGNDQVFLMNGSTTTGDIDLGDGDDWLTLVGPLVVTGNITGANGIDTLVFDGAGSIGITPMAFENAIKQGAGTFTVAGLPTMQRIEIRQGTLQVNNNYQFSNSGFFQTFVNGDGNFGQFKVNGTTDLAGDLNVLKGSGPFLNGTTYNIIEANAVNNAFSNVTLPPPNNFVSFRMNQFPTIVQIEVYAKDFTWLARNRVEWAVANYLDRILPFATGDLWGMLGQIQNLSQGEFYKALSTLSPDSYDNFTRTTYATTHRYNKSLQYRMNNVRSYLHVNQPGNETPILLAYRGSDVGELFSSGRVSQIQGKNGLWFDAFGQWGDQGEENRYRWNDGYTGYDYFMRGATLGFDHALSDKLMAGVSVGYSRADIDLDHHQGSGYIKSLYGSIYGSYFYKNLYIDGIFSYGKNWYDNHRLITIGMDQRKAYSKHDGNLFSAYLQGGYYFDIKKWLIGPFASLQYIYLDEESFNEKGANGVSLRIDSRQTDSLVSELGLRLLRVLKTKYGSFIPEVSAAWLHDFDIDDRVITSSFTGSPGALFSIKGQDVERNGATLGVGITFVHKSGLSTSLKYIGEFREKYKSNGIMGELRFAF